MANTRYQARKKRKTSIRKKISGTPERPRLTIFRSNRHIYSQVIDDEANQVLASVSTMSKDLRQEVGGDNKTDQAKKVGTKIAERCLAKGIKKVVFDRNGYQYHGRIVALATSSRKAGLDF